MPLQGAGDGAYGYRICIGGRWGKKVAQGQALHKVFPSEQEVLDVLEKALLLFRDQGIPGERFADTIARLGFENVEAQLLSDDLLQRKAEILGQAHRRRRDLLSFFESRPVLRKFPIAFVRPICYNSCVPFGAVVSASGFGARPRASNGP